MSKEFFVKSGYPVRENNFVQPFVAPDEAWRSIYNHIQKAEESIHLSFWSFNSLLEMIRNDSDKFKPESSRKKYRIFNVLDAKAKQGVKVRILLWIPSATMRGDYLVYLSGLVGKFEVLYQTNHIIGSWHQKTVVVDGKYGFVAGMNAGEDYWDTLDHEVLDIRRFTSNSSTTDRRKIIANKAYGVLFKPFQDYTALIAGPIVTDVEANFIERWNYCYDQKNHHYKKAKRLKAPKKNAGFADIRAQVTRTMPKWPIEPGGETSILDTYLQAIRQAKHYIYIENQYFRSEIIAKALAKAYTKNNKLVIIVVTNPDFHNPLGPDDQYKLASASTYWTSNAYQIIKKAFPDFVLFFLQSSEIIKTTREFVSFYNHSKVMIIDDEWYTIGSANVNDRSFYRDGEINVSVHHYSAKQFRKDIFSAHMKEPCPDDIKKASALWYKHCNENMTAWKKGKKPKSFIYSYGVSGPIIPMFPASWV